MKKQLIMALHATIVMVILLPMVYLGQAAADICYSSNCGTTITDTSTLFGQTQSYDVLLRGNGEAVVNANISLTNNDPKPLSTLKYSVVSGQLESVTAFQQVSCTDLPIIKPAGSTVSTNATNLSPAAAPTAGANPLINTVTRTDIPECYQGLSEHPLNSASQLAYYYPSAVYVYKKVTVGQTGNSFSLSLPQGVITNKSSNIVMVYNLAAVSHKSLGVLSYDFKTLKAATAVSDVTVAISVDENYILADAANGSVNYRSAKSSNALSSSLHAGTAQAATGADSASVNNYVSSIGSNGGINKHASSLSPQETYTVKGRFASTSFLLNWPRTVLRWAAVLVIIGALVYWYIRNRKRLQGRPYNISTMDSDDKASKVMQTIVEPEKHAKAETSEQTSVDNSFADRQASVSVRALPFYGLTSTLRKYLQERRVRPMFFAWLCGILSVGLLGGVIWGYSALSSINNSFSSIASSSLLIPVLYIFLAAVGLLGFFFFCVGLPILYAGSFKRALRIFAHIMVFFIIIGIVLVALAIKLNKDSNVNPGVCNYSYNNCGSCGSGGAIVCPGLENPSNGAVQSTTK